MNVQIVEAELQLQAPLHTSHGSIESRRLIEVHVTEGEHEGIGEAAPLPGFGLETYEEALAELRRWGSGIPAHGSPTGKAAAGAANTALAQLRAAQTGASLATFLKTATVSRTPLAVQALIGALEPDACASQAAAFVAAGHLGIKLKVGVTDATTDVRRVRSVRAAAPGVVLRLDANCGWTPNQATEVLNSLADEDIDFVEEPTSNPAEFAEISVATGCAIAIDEHAVSVEAMRELIQSGDIAAVILKPAVLSGVQATYDMGLVAQSLGCRTIVSSFIDGAASLRAAKELALALDPNEIHGLGTASMFTDALPLDVTPDRGHLA
jgi:o-succinylbenzoate synthase